MKKTLIVIDMQNDFIDDRDRGRKGIEEMLVRMSKMTDMPDNPKKNKTQI